MRENYIDLFFLPKNLYADNVPVMLSAGVLRKDSRTGKLFVQLRMQNISTNFKQIIALKVLITSYSPSGAILGEQTEYQYLDLSAKRGEEFGQKLPIIIENIATRSFTVDIIEVVFADGKTWTGTTKDWQSLGEQKPLEDALGKSLAEQYRRDTYSAAKYEPFPSGKLWKCACGALNYLGESCCCCRKTLSELALAMDHNALSAHLEEYEKDLAAKQQIKQEKESRRKKKNKKIIISIASVIIIALLVSTILSASANKKIEKSIEESLVNSLWYHPYDPFDNRDPFSLFITFIDSENVKYNVFDPKNIEYDISMYTWEIGEIGEGKAIVYFHGKESLDVYFEETGDKIQITRMTTHGDYGESFELLSSNASQEASPA